MQKEYSDPITLSIDGIDWPDWKDAEIVQQIDAVAGSFAIALAEPMPSTGEAKAQPLTAGLECEVKISNDVVISGFIDKASPSVSQNDHGISIDGRDRSADLVDCSAVHEPGHWQNLNALDLASILAEPFGVSVSSQSDVGAPFPSFKLEQGETAFDAIDRALKQRELLACPDGKGGILLVRVGEKSSNTSLETGKNILTASATYDVSDRYSHYLCQGQQPSNDDVYGVDASEVTSEVQDQSIKRYRPLIIRAEDPVDSASAKQRADWERTVRAARSVNVTATVQGFRQDNGELWQINSLVQVNIPYLKINQELLIAKSTFSRSRQGGSITTLELKDPKSFMPEPKSPPASGGEPNNGSGEALSQDDFEIEEEQGLDDLLEQSTKSSKAEHEKIKEGT